MRRFAQIVLMMAVAAAARGSEAIAMPTGPTAANTTPDGANSTSAGAAPAVAGASSLPDGAAAEASSSAPQSAGALAPSGRVAASSMAPRFAPLEMAFNYSYARANAGPGQCGCFNMNGGSAEASLHYRRGLSWVIDLTGAHAANIGGNPPVQLGLFVVSEGPRYSYRTASGRTTVFAQGLLGLAHGFDSIFPSKTGPAKDTATSFALLAGGGVDISLNKYVALRVVQADYLRTQLPNSISNQQNLLRLSAGIIFKAWWRQQ